MEFVRRSHVKIKVLKISMHQMDSIDFMILTIILVLGKNHALKNLLLSKRTSFVLFPFRHRVYLRKVAVAARVGKLLVIVDAVNLSV